MSFRLELEIVEADGLPLSNRGGRPDPFVTVQIAHRRIKERTITIAASQNPMWGQRFVVTACNPTETLLFTMWDRDDTPVGFIGKVELTVGGPSRAVGSRWLQLDGKDTRLRVVWEMVPEDGSSMHNVHVSAADAIAAARKDPALFGNILDRPTSRPAAASGTTVATENTKKGSDDDHNGTDADSAASTGVEAKLLELMAKYDAKFAELDRRLLDIEALVRGQRMIEMSVAQPQSRPTSAGTASSGRLAALQSMLEPGTIVSTALAPSAHASGNAGAGDALLRTAQAVADTRREFNSDSKSALESILQRPTRLSADDEQIIANYHFAPVALPTIPSHHNSHQGGASGGATFPTSALDRKLETATASLAHTSRMLSSTLH